VRSGAAAEPDGGLPMFRAAWKQGRSGEAQPRLSHVSIEEVIFHGEAEGREEEGHEEEGCEEEEVIQSSGPGTSRGLVAARWSVPDFSTHGFCSKGLEALR